MGNSKTLVNSLTTSQNSYGSALKENTVYMDSIVAKTNQFNQATQDMWQNTISSDFVKGIVDLGTEIVSIVDKFGLMNTAVLITSLSLLVFKTNIGAAMVMSLAKAGVGIKALSWVTSIFTSNTIASTIAVKALKLALTLGLSLALTGVIMLVSKLIKKHQEQKISISETTAAYKESTAELDRLKNELSEIRNLDSYDPKIIESLEKEIDLLEKKIALQEQILGINEKQDARDAIAGIDLNGVEKAQKKLRELDRDIRHYKDQILETDKENYEIQSILQKNLSDLQKDSVEINKELLETYESLSSAISVLGYEELTQETYEYYLALRAFLNITTDAPSHISAYIDSQKALALTLKNGKNEYEEFLLTQEEYLDSIEKANDAIDAYQSSLSELGGLQDIINKGEKLSIIQLVDLSQKYPTLVRLINNANSSKEDGLKLTEAIMKEDKKRYTQEFQLQKISLENNIKANKELFNILLLQTKLTEATAYSLTLTEEGRKSLADMGSMAGVIENLKRELNGVVNAMTLLETSSLGDFSSESSKVSENTKKSTTELGKYFHTLEKIKRTREELAFIEAKESTTGIDATEEKVALLKKMQNQLKELNDLRRADRDAYLAEYNIIKDIVGQEERAKELLLLMSGLISDINSTSVEWWNIQKQITDELDVAGKEAKKLQDEMKAIEAQMKSIEESQKSFNSLIDKTVDLIKKENQLYKDQLNTRKDSLKLAKDEADLLKELAELNQERSDIEEELFILKLDNSGRNNAKILELEDKLAKSSKAINEKLEEDKYNKQIQTLDDEIDAVNNYLSKEGKLREDAMDRINEAFRTGNNQLLNDLIWFNEKYGTSIESDITNMWYAAEEALRSFGGALTNMNIGGTIGSMSQELIKLQMALNSAAWHTVGTQAEKDSLHQANKILGAQLGASFNPSTSLWDFGSNSSGVSNNPSLSGGGSMTQYSGVPKPYAETMSYNSPTNMTFEMVINGVQNSSLIPAIESAGRKVSSDLLNVANNQGFNRIRI